MKLLELKDERKELLKDLAKLKDLRSEQWVRLTTELHYLKKLGYDRDEILRMTPVERLVFQLTISDIERELNQAQLDSMSQ